MFDWRRLMQHKTRWLIIAMGVVLLSGISFYLTLRLMLGTTETVVVPDLVGVVLIDALDELGKLGISARVSKMSLSEQYENGKIIEQHPSAGRRIKAGRSIQLSVSQGLTELTMVNLLGMDQKVAEQTLSNNAMSLMQIMSSCSEQRVGQVIGQNPAPFQPVSRQQTISMVVSNGSCANFYLVPDLRNTPITQVMTELSYSQIPTLREERLKTRSRGRFNDKVLDQEPPAGHLVALKPAYSYIGPQLLRLGVPLGFRAEEENSLKLYYISKLIPYGFRSRQLKIRTYLPDLTATEIDITAPAGKNIAWTVPILHGLKPEMILDEE